MPSEDLDGFWEMVESVGGMFLAMADALNESAAVIEQAVAESRRADERRAEAAVRDAFPWWGEFDA